MRAAVDLAQRARDVDSWNPVSPSATPNAPDAQPRRTCALHARKRSVLQDLSGPVRTADPWHSSSANPAEDIAAEILALTKLNWNRARLDGKKPITLLTAQRVGQILRHVPAAVAPAPRYANYM